MTRWMPAALMLVATAAATQARAQSNPSFNVENRAGALLTEVYASPAGVTNWGRNRLVGVAVPPGQRYAIRLPVGACTYDVRVVFANGQSDEARSVNTCEVDDLAFPTTAGPAAPRDGRGGRSAGRQNEATDDPSFRLVNTSRSEINELYATPVGDDGWGRDLLGDDTVAPGASKVIRLPAGQCRWDVRIVYANGKSTEKRRLDLCSITDLRRPKRFSATRLR